METMMQQWRMWKARTMNRTSTVVAVAVQDRALLVETYEKRVMKLEKEVQTEGERRYCALVVLASSRPRVPADPTSVRIQTPWTPIP
jgi:hypothetical protein